MHITTGWQKNTYLVSSEESQRIECQKRPSEALTWPRSSLCMVSCLHYHAKGQDQIAGALFSSAFGKQIWIQLSPVIHCPEGKGKVSHLWSMYLLDCPQLGLAGHHYRVERWVLLVPRHLSTPHLMPPSVFLMHVRNQSSINQLWVRLVGASSPHMAIFAAFVAEVWSWWGGVGGA